MNNCKVCGSIIHNNRIYCSDKCKDKHRYRNTIYIKNCKVCGEEFPATKGMTTCSPECNLKSQKRYEKICPMCKNVFVGRGNGIYCSDICYRTANSHTKGLTISSCDVCGSSFKTLRSNPRATCSDSCGSKLFSTYISRANIEVFGTANKKEINIMLTNRRIKNEN